jgi:membrane fusion protein (multidrug efflux system)
MLNITQEACAKETRMKKYWKTIAVVIMIIVIAAVVVLRIRSLTHKPPAFGHAPTPVKVSKPERQLMTNEIQYDGNVVAIQQTSIVSKVSGSLEQVLVDIGDAVQKNQVLAVIDSVESYQQALEAEATYGNNELNYQRTKELLDQNLVAKEVLDNAETAMKTSKAIYELAKTTLGYTRILAPFSGYITSRYVDPGALISANNTELFTLMDLSSLKVTINVLEKDTPLIPTLKKAAIVADALPEIKFEGKIARYSHAVDQTTRTMKVEIDVPNSNLLLKPGMFVTATIIISEHPDAITVPTAAAMKDNQGSYVYVVEEDIARRAPVQTGIQQNNMTEIVSGLTGDEDVITTGQHLARDGAPVKVQP